MKSRKFWDWEDNKTKEILDKIAPIVLERISKFGDIKEMAERESWHIFHTGISEELLLWKKIKMKIERASVLSKFGKF